MAPGGALPGGRAHVQAEGRSETSMGARRRGEVGSASIVRHSVSTRGHGVQGRVRAYGTTRSSGLGPRSLHAQDTGRNLGWAALSCVRGCKQAQRVTRRLQVALHRRFLERSGLLRSPQPTASTPSLWGEASGPQELCHSMSSSPGAGAPTAGDLAQLRPVSRGALAVCAVGVSELTQSAWSKGSFPAVVIVIMLATAVLCIFLNIMFSRKPL